MHLLKDSDHVIFMEDQRISHQGTPSEVQDSIPNFDAQSADEDNDGATADEEPQGTKCAAADAESEMDQEIHNLITSTGDTSLYWYYLKSIGWKYGLMGLFFAVSQTFFTVFNRESSSTL